MCQEAERPNEDRSVEVTAIDKQNFIKEISQVEEDHIYRNQNQQSSGRD